MIVVTLMAVLGIGGGFAGLWWGWSTGTRWERFEAEVRYLADRTNVLALQFSNASLSVEETVEAFNRLIEYWAVTDDLLGPNAPPPPS